MIVVGSSNTDMVVKAPNLPAPGETVLGENLVVAHGGKGANQAVAAVRLGASVAFVACLGDDAFGRDALTHYRAEGINVLQNNGRCSGQAVLHVHIHFIPRWPEDGLGFRWPAKEADPKALEEQAEAVRMNLT